MPALLIRMWTPPSSALACGDHRLDLAEIGDAGAAGDRRAAGGADLLDHARGGVALPGAVARAAEIVDHDPGAAPSELERISPAEAAAGAGDDGDAAFEADRHAACPPRHSERGLAKRLSGTRKGPPTGARCGRCGGPLAASGLSSGLTAPLVGLNAIVRYRPRAGRIILGRGLRRRRRGRVDHRAAHARRGVEAGRHGRRIRDHRDAARVELGAGVARLRSWSCRRSGRAAPANMMAATKSTDFIDFPPRLGRPTHGARSGRG